MKVVDTKVSKGILHDAENRAGVQIEMPVAE
jgi:hypothetical protein